MRIGIEAERANVQHATGVERYASEVIRNLARIDRTNEYILYFRSQPQAWFKELPPNFKIKVIPFPKFWTQTRLAFELLIHPVDVFFMPIQALPFLHPRNSVITLHDLAYEYYPQAFAPFMRFYLKLTTRWGVHMAKKIITVSESTKNDAIKTYGITPIKVIPAQLGLDGTFKPVPYAEVQPILDTEKLTYKKYILHVGTLQPRKNIEKLVDAYLKLRRDFHIEEKLVIAGGKGWMWEPILAKIEAAKNDGVVYLEFVSESFLHSLYSGAVCLAFPSLYEGFGLPSLEAMASGTPVVVSNISSLPEVAGEAGTYVEPSSVDSIAQGIMKVLESKQYQEEKSKLGLERAKGFTWDSCARKILEVFEGLKS